MAARRRMRGVVVMLGLVVLVSALSGCASLGPQGKTLLHDYRIALPDQRDEKNYYADRNVGIDYEFSRGGSTLTIAGTVRFLGPIVNNFTVIRYFNLQVLLANANGVILASHGLTSSVSPDPTDTFTFQRTLALPPGTAFMGFSYTGEVIAGGDFDGLGTTSIWQYPVL